MVERRYEQTRKKPKARVGKWEYLIPCAIANVVRALGSAYLSLCSCVMRRALRRSAWCGGTQSQSPAGRGGCILCLVLVKCTFLELALSRVLQEASFFLRGLAPSSTSPPFEVRRNAGHFNFTLGHQATSKLKLAFLVSPLL